MTLEGVGKHAEVEALLRLLFKPHKTIRDAIHKDIKLTHLEIDIIDTKDFQRLHGLKQLGTSYMVYPTAVHTRFSHSLGCLHIGQNLINEINNNPYSDVKIGQYSIERLLIRLCCLLHDVCNVPFGHTLEDEGRLFEKQWVDEERVRHFLDKGSEIADKILTNETLKELCTENGYSQFCPESVLSSIRDYLIAIESGKIEETSKPYVCDIVGNTICADLLDYIRRDIYFTGLHGDYDDRILSYFYITNFGRKPRLVLRLLSLRKETLQRSILSELLGLLRLRYSLAEKVYYHKVKIYSSAMIISAVNDLLQDVIISPSDLYPMTDEELVARMKSPKNESGEDASWSAPNRIIDNLLARRLYKPVYGLKYGREEMVVGERSKREMLRADLMRKENRWDLERTLETQNFCKRGTIVVYCPGPEMGHKIADTLVYLGEDRFGPLNKVAHQDVKDELEAIINQHHALWRMYILVDTTISKDVMKNIHGETRSIFDLGNELPECAIYSDPNHVPYPVRYEERFLATHIVEKKLSSDECINVASIALRTNENYGKYKGISYQDYERARFSSNK